MSCGDQFEFNNLAERQELFPGSAYFDQVNARLREITDAQQDAPDEDALHYETARLQLYGRAADYLHQNEQAELVTFYRAVGARMLQDTDEKRAQQLRSAERLASYVADGILDTVSLEELERRIQELQGAQVIGKYFDVYDELFSSLHADILTVDTPEEVGNKPAAHPDGSRSDGEPMSLEQSLQNHPSWSAAQRAYILSCTQKPVRIEELRSTVPAIRALKDPEYQQLKHDLKETRDQAIEWLEQYGYKVHWSVTGQRRGTRYECIIEPSIELTEEETATPPDTVTAERIIYRATRQRRRRQRSGEDQEWKRAAEFTADLVLGIQGIMGKDALHQRKFGYVCREVAKWLDIEREDANELVKKLLDEEILFVEGTDKGSPVLTFDATRAVERRERRRTGRAPKAAHKEEKLFVPEEIRTADTVCRTLLQTGHQNKGMTVKSLSEAVGMEITELRPLISRMVKAGVVNTEEGMERSKSPHSRKKTVQYVKFPTQNAWHRYKAEPEEYMSVLPREDTTEA